MADYSDQFLEAFNSAMLYEVGPHWDPTDPDVISGTIDTQEQRRKVGYTNITGDSGGVTKYGIAQNSHPELSVRDLDLNNAMGVYQQSYWNKSHCDSLPYPSTIFYFDCCVNLGLGRGAKMLQQSLGVTVDGQIGPGTIEAANQQDQNQLIESLSKNRTDFYNSIVERNPSQEKFLVGWLRRVDEVTATTISKI